MNVETIDLSECQSDYSSFELEVTERMFCAMSMNKDSCQVRDASTPMSARGLLKATWASPVKHFEIPGPRSELTLLLPRCRVTRAAV